LPYFPRINIAFPGGAYGHYMKWILYSLLIDEPLIAPWVGSTSHSKDYISDYAKRAKLFETNMCQTIQEVADSPYQITIAHPGSPTNDPSFLEGMQRISTLVDYVLMPYFDHNTYLLGIHNWLYKSTGNINISLAYVDREDLQKGWGIDTSQDLNDLPRWILREHHSMNIFNSWDSQCAWFAPTKFSKINCQYVFISDLFYNFLSTIESIKQFLGVEWIRDPIELLPYHKINIANQQYKTQDIIATQILQSVSNNVNFTWNASDITLQTEAYIQRALQHQGIMLQCNGLNVFPTSTKQLIEVFE
jgi:hypothetical protein